MTRGVCDKHLSTPSGIISHLLLIASFLSNLKSLPHIKTNGNKVEKDGTGSSLSTSTTRDATAKTNFQMIQSDGGYNADPDIQHILNEMASANVPGLDKLAQSIATKYEVDQLRKRLSEKDSVIYALQDKVQNLESTIQTKSSENEDRDFRLSLMENSNYDGTMVWKIPQFSQRMEDARTGKYTSIFSLPFYSSHYGYKMCLRLYILGDGIGKGTHMSLFFVVMKGEFDNILQWPFTQKVTFKLINQCGGRDIIDIFQPDPLSSSFQKPKSDMNVASGCPRFVSLNELMQGGFIVEDTVFIKVKVDVTTMKHP